jgi:hypothetical protein
MKTTVIGREVPVAARVAAALGWTDLIGYCRNAAERDCTHHEPCQVVWWGKARPWEPERPIPNYDRDWGLVGPYIDRYGIALALEPHAGHAVWVARFATHEGRGATARGSLCAVPLAAFASAPIAYRVLCRGVTVAAGEVAGASPAGGMHEDAAHEFACRDGTTPRACSRLRLTAV